MNDNNPSIKIYTNKIENSITSKTKAGFCLELLTPETMKLLGSTKSNITEDGNGEKVPHLTITEVVLVPCYIINNNYQQVPRVLYTSFQIIWWMIRYFNQKFCFEKHLRIFIVLNYVLLMEALNYLR